MKYDLVHFDPIQNVIQLRQADDHAQAAHVGQLAIYVFDERSAIQ